MGNNQVTKCACNNVTVAGVVKLIVLMLVGCSYFCLKGRGEFQCLRGSLSHYVTMSKLIVSGLICFNQ